MAGKFEPKVPVNLNPPKDDPISLEELAKANGAFSAFFQTAAALEHFVVHVETVLLYNSYGLSLTDYQ